MSGVQSASLLLFRMHTRGQYGPFVVVVLVPLSTLPVWKAQFKHWAPDMNVIPYIGNAALRKVVRDFEFLARSSSKCFQRHMSISANWADIALASSLTLM